MSEDFVSGVVFDLLTEGFEGSDFRVEVDYDYADYSAFLIKPIEVVPRVITNFRTNATSEWRYRVRCYGDRVSVYPLYSPNIDRDLVDLNLCDPNCVSGLVELLTKRLYHHKCVSNVK